ncbi:holo-ACP synthase [bacterium]|nr:holo-ACP synthase [bacterium]
MILGVGTDLVEVARIRRMLEDWGEGFLRKVYTPGERDYCARRAQPWTSLAARFAAKEAFLKALPERWQAGVGWKDREVVRGESGKPTMIGHGRAQEALSALSARVHLSLTHTADFALAVVILERDEA